MRLPLTTILLSLLLLPATAGAEPTLRESGTPAASRNVFALELIGGTAIDAQGERHNRAGAALLFEQPIIPRWLAGEISVGTTVSEHGTFIPVELLLKVPLNVTTNWQLYAGAGPAMVYDYAHREASFGGVASVGTFYWLSQRVGLVFEIDYLILHANGAEHEIEGAAGVAWRI